LTVNICNVVTVYIEIILKCVSCAFVFVFFKEKTHEGFLIPIYDWLIMFLDKYSNVRDFISMDLLTLIMYRLSSANVMYSDCSVY